MLIRLDAQPSSPVRSSVHCLCTLLQNLQAVETALSVGSVQKPAKMQGMPSSTLKLWVHNRDKLKERVDYLCCTSQKTRVHRVNGKQQVGFGDDVEAELLVHCRERRKCKLVVTTGLLVAYWKAIDKEKANAVSTNAARLRMRRFLNRHNLAWRKKTHEAQVNRTNTGIRNNFLQCTLWKKQLLGITDDCAVVNVDEINVYFSPFFERTIAEKGSKTVAILQPNSAKRCTAMLGCSLAGDKLPPFIIYQGQNTVGGHIVKEVCDAVSNGYSDGVFCSIEEGLDG